MKALNEKIWKEEQLEATPNLSSMRDLVDESRGSNSNIDLPSLGGGLMVEMCAMPMGLSCGGGGSWTHNVYLCNGGGWSPESLFPGIKIPVIKF